MRKDQRIWRGIVFIFVGILVIAVNFVNYINWIIGLLFAIGGIAITPEINKFVLNIVFKKTQETGTQKMNRSPHGTQIQAGHIDTLNVGMDPNKEPIRQIKSPYEEKIIELVKEKYKDSELPKFYNKNMKPWAAWRIHADIQNPEFLESFKKAMKKLDMVPTPDQS